jgi:hypothetical protein
MGATKESPATQVLEWAVGKLSEASKTDWVDKLSALATSRPAYLRDGLLTPHPAAAGAGVGRSELDAALDRAARAEAKNRDLTQRVAALEQELTGLRSGSGAGLAGDPGDAGESGAAGDDDHRSHWWSRHH